MSEMKAVLLGTLVAPDSRDRERVANILLPVECLRQQYAPCVTAVCFSFSLPAGVRDTEAYVRAEVRLFKRSALTDCSIDQYLFTELMKQFSGRSLHFPAFVYRDDAEYQCFYNQITFPLAEAWPRMVERPQNSPLRPVEACSARNCIFERQREVQVQRLFEDMQHNGCVSAGAIRRHLKRCANPLLRETLQRMQKERKKWEKRDFLAEVGESGSVGGSICRSVVG